MLTETEAMTMLTRAKASAAKRTFTRPAKMLTHIGGPLDGWIEPVEPDSLHSYRHGWCIVTETGPVQALYAIDRKRCVATFAEYHTTATARARSDLRCGNGKGDNAQHEHS